MKVTLLMAMTLDGKIAKDSDHFPDWTGKADKKFFMERTKEAGCLIMGSKTFDTIGRPLPGRKNVIMTRKERDSEWENLVFTADSPQEILANLKSEGYEEAILGGGAQINTLWAEGGLIDEVVLTISPLFFGQGMGLFSEEVELNLELVELTTLDDDLVCVHYKVLK